MNLITKSRLAVARACQRKHRLKYELGYGAITEAGALRFGSLVHDGLEAYWRARMAWLDALDAALAAIASKEADDFDRAKAIAMLNGYVRRWAEEDARYRVIAVEAQFEAPLINPATGAASRTWNLGGKLDVVLEEIATGRRVFVEHKTSSEDISAGSPYWALLRMDTQVSVYFQGVMSLGHDVEECVYDVLGKPQQRPSAVPIIEDGAKVVLDSSGARVRTKNGKKWRETADGAAGYVLQTRPETVEEFRARVTEAIAAEPNRYFARGSVVRLESEQSEALQDVWDTAKQIHEAKLAGRAPKNPGACMDWGRPCEFFAVCSGAASLDDPQLFRRRENVHPELNTEPKEIAQ